MKDEYVEMVDGVARKFGGRITRITTDTGSEYNIAERPDGTFVVFGNNVVSPYSQSIGDGVWPVNKPTPWPPVLGEVIFIESTLVSELPGTPGRLPGGGKHTSPVRTVHTQEEV